VAIDNHKKLVEQFPAVAQYQTDLGCSYYNYGNKMSGEGKFTESLEWFDLGIRTLKSVHDQNPQDPMNNEFLWNCLIGRARAYDRLQKFAEAVKDWDRAIELMPPAGRPGLRADRAISQIQAGMVSEVEAEVAELSKSPNWNADQWYNFACAYAVASAKHADKKPEYADRAIELLRKAVHAGWKDAAHMAKDTDLDPLRGREDFKKLMAELVNRPTAKPKTWP
jgi:eukaryotic-like serine/threonine-protein kinase